MASMSTTAIAIDATEEATNLLLGSTISSEQEIPENESGGQPAEIERIPASEIQEIAETEKTADGVVEPIPESERVAAIGNKYYKTLAAAVKEAASGDTITILNDVDEAPGISVPSGKEFTIDFDGHTYTLSNPGAGSTGTETNGFQLLQGSNITFKNGTIRISDKNGSVGSGNPIGRIIQNYANLTLENMQIYAENQAGGEDMH